MNINKDHQCSTKDLGSFSSSFFELQSFYSSSSPPHESCAHPHLPAILLEEDEETRHPKVGPPILSSDDSLILSSFTPSKNTDVPSHHKNDGEFDQSSDTLQSLVQSCCCGNILTVQENSIRSLCGNNIQECKHQNNKPIVISDSSRNLSPYSLLSFNKNNSNTENYHQCSKSHLEKQQQQPIVSFGGTTTLKFGSIKVVSGKETKKKIKNKTRIKWTEELDKKFIESVDRLGGARKATPKEILKLMKCNGLTIFHVKSHLQKYRCGQHISQAKEGNAEQLDSKTGVEIVEALRLQMDVQRSLYEQLESQKKLQMRIEEQAKQLQNMIKCQLNTK